MLVKPLEDKHAHPEIKTVMEDILRLMVGIMDPVSNKGFTLECWLKVTNVMIYKNQGIYLINKLRVIHL